MTRRGKTDFSTNKAALRFAHVIWDKYNGRQRGDFIGSFAVFGYRKAPENHHRLLVDDYAADVVRDMFKWKLEGVSVIDIAGRLTGLDIPAQWITNGSRGCVISPHSK